MGGILDGLITNTFLVHVT